MRKTQHFGDPTIYGNHHILATKCLFFGRYDGKYERYVHGITDFFVYYPSVSSNTAGNCSQHLLSMVPFICVSYPLHQTWFLMVKKFRGNWNWWMRLKFGFHQQSRGLEIFKTCKKVEGSFSYYLWDLFCKGITIRTWPFRMTGKTCDSMGTQDPNGRMASKNGYGPVCWENQRPSGNDWHSYIAIEHVPFSSLIYLFKMVMFHRFL